MRFDLRLVILICFLVLGLCFALGRLTGIKTSEKNQTEEMKPGKAETALKVLTENCGKCHQSTLLTAKSEALAIFDLDKKTCLERTATLDFIACLCKGNCQNKD